MGVVASRLNLSDVNGDPSKLDDALASNEYTAVSVVDDTNGTNKVLTIPSSRSLTVPSGKTLNLEDGITLNNKGGVTVYGTLKVTGDVTNSSNLTVYSGQSLHVTGNITNTRGATLSAESEGFIEAAGIVNESTGEVRVSDNGSIKATTIENKDAESSIVIRGSGVITGTVTTNGGWILEGDGKLKVGSNNAAASGAAWRTSYASEVTSAEIASGVTEIGDSAFSGCSNLASVTLPDSVTTIGDSAFKDCTGLTAFSLAKVTNLGLGVFEGCTNLTAFTVSADNTAYSAVDGVLYDKAGTTIALCPAGKTSYTIPAAVTTIGKGAFLSCTKLTAITIPDTVTDIRDNAFNDCTGLTSVTIPSSVAPGAFGATVFTGCSALEDIWFENTGFGTAASAPNTGAGSTTTVHTTTGANSFGNNGFTYTQWNNDMGGTTSVTLEIVGSGAMDNYAYDARTDRPWNGYIDKVTNIKLSDGITSIGNNAFYNCVNLEEITFPDGVTSIGFHAFYGCGKLEEITFPDKVTSIGNYAFYGCGKLEEITFSDKLLTIGKCAFSGCKTLKTLEFPKGLTSIGGRAFEQCDSITEGEIVIPASVGDLNGEGSGQIFTKDPFVDCSNLKFIIEGTDMQIGYNTFSNSKNFTLSLPVNFSAGMIDDNSLGNTSDITIEFRKSDAYTEISASVLESQTAVKKVILPDNITKIGDSAFKSMSKLEEINLPDSLTEIGANAFTGCTALTSITWKGTTYNTVDDFTTAFTDAGNTMN